MDVRFPGRMAGALAVAETIAEKILGHPADIVVRTWLAPGVGPVQSEVLDKAALGGGGGPQVREELKSFTK